MVTLKNIAFTLFCLALPTHSYALADLLQCHGRSVLEVDLSQQFGPTKDQSSSLCYSYVSIAGLEAAIFRHTGKRHSLSAEFLAICNIEENFTPHDVHSILKTNQSDLGLGGDHPFHANQTLNRLPQVCLDAPQVRSTYQQFVKSTCDEIAKLPFPIKAQLIEKMCQLIKANAKKWAKNTLAHFPKLAIDLKDYQPVNVVTDAPQNVPCSLEDSDTRKKIAGIMKYLCAGLPVISSIIAPEIVHSKDGGKSWQVSKGENPQKPLQHAMVLQRVAYEKGRPFFYFRNTWKEGSKEIPQASMAKIPLELVCQFESITTYLARSDLSSKGQSQKSPIIKDIFYKFIDFTTPRQVTIRYADEKK